MLKFFLVIDFLRHGGHMRGTLTVQNATVWFFLCPCGRHPCQIGSAAALFISHSGPRPIGSLPDDNNIFGDVIGEARFVLGAERVDEKSFCPVVGLVTYGASFVRMVVLGSAGRAGLVTPSVFVHRAQALSKEPSRDILPFYGLPG